MLKRVVILGLVLVGVLWVVACSEGPPPPIRVGILHADSGSLAHSEQAVSRATLLAIEELNDSGGVLGSEVQAVMGRGISEPEDFVREARRLIDEEGVVVLFGGWTSTARKALLPLLSGRRHLLFYPLQYEGLESSPFVVYTGAVPNQQMVPGIKWALDHLGSRFFLVGSDYVYPRTAHEIAKTQLTVLGAEVVGEEYIPLGGDQVQEAVQAIVASDADVILNTINGDSNVALFKAFKEAGVTTPVLSLSLGEHDHQSLDLPEGEEHYAAWNYFQSLDSPENRRFLARYRARYGLETVTSDPMEAAYLGVHLWAQAVEEAGSPEPIQVRGSLGGQSFVAPGGLVSVDESTQHIWKTVRVGRLQEDGQFEVVWESQGPVRPRPYPFFRTVTEWENYLEGLMSP